MWTACLSVMMAQVLPARMGARALSICALMGAPLLAAPTGSVLSVASLLSEDRSDVSP
jgi:hypothetical protein